MSQVCCAEMYERDWVQEFLGDSMHPGGLALSRRLWRGLPLGRPGALVADVACGTGTTAVALALERDVRVVAIDLGPSNLAKTALRAVDAGVGDRVRCVEADAVRLPLEDGELDALICECAVSTFPDKRAVVAEFARVVRPGGVIAITDMVVNGELPRDVASVLAPWTCVGAALSVEGYQRLFLDGGLRCVSYADETAGLYELLLDLKRRLVVAALGGLAVGLEELDLDLEEARRLLAVSRGLVDSGTVQYARFSFSKGTPSVAAVDDEACDPSTGCCA